MQHLLLLVFGLFILFILYNLVKKKNVSPQPDAQKEKDILQQHVWFYKGLAEEEKKEFRKKVAAFLEKVRITGIDTEIDDRDRVFVASGAIIPIFYYKDWESIVS
jgi:Mlc titration factor MtfA (ptsG expression regulator)